MNTSSRALRSSLLSIALVSLLISSGCARKQEAEVVSAAETEEVYTPPVFNFEREDFSGEAAAGFEPIVDPAYPTLPYVVDEETTEEELASIALQATLAEEARGEIELEAVPNRHQDILAFWTPQHEALKEIVAANQAERSAYQDYQIAEIRHRMEWEHRQDVLQLAWDHTIRQEKLRILPLVPPDLHERLIRQLRTADPQRSRWCNVVP